jgi:glutaredoxin/glutathione-dependent peroxiredoxin
VAELSRRLVMAAFVMAEWAKSLGNGNEGVTMLSDGNLELTKALGLVLDATSKGMGLRAKRFAMVVSQSGYVVDLEVDEVRVDKTAAKAVLSKL